MNDSCSTARSRKDEMRDGQSEYKLEVFLICIPDFFLLASFRKDETRDGQSEYK